MTAEKQISSLSSLRTGLYKTTKTMFFLPSKRLEAQITDVFDGLWGTVTAAKNLRWQVRGFCEEYEHTKSNIEITQKFVEKKEDSNVRPNLYRVCIQDSWADTEYRISRDFLINIFACYEGWVEDILTIFSANTKKMRNDLQYPKDGTHDYERLLATLQTGTGNAVSTAFYDLYKNKNVKYNLDKVQNWLLYFRYFKECRNCIIHDGGLTNQKVIDAYTAITSLTKEDLDVKECPITISTNLGDPIQLSLRGVVGFSQLILRLVCTFDVEFIKTDMAETYFIQVMRVECPSPKNYGLADEVKMVRKLLGHTYFQLPDEVHDLYTYLCEKGVLKETNN